MKKVLFVVMVMLLTQCTNKTDNPVSTINPMFQEIVDSLSREIIFNESSLINCYCLILEDDGRCSALVNLDTTSAAGRQIMVPDTIASQERLYAGNLWQMVSLMGLFTKYPDLTPSTMIPNNDHLPGWPGKISYRYDDAEEISVKNSIQRGGDSYAVCFLSYLCYLRDDPAIVMYREFESLFPTCISNLSARQDYPEALQTLYKVASGYSYQVDAQDLAFFYHTLFIGGTGRRPYINIHEPGERVTICSKSVADSLLSITIDTTYLATIPVSKRSSTIVLAPGDSEEGTPPICQRCFVGSFNLGEKPVTIFCKTDYPAEPKESFPRPSPAEKLFREIAEFMIETKN